MFQQGRIIIVWLSWLIGGICGVVILLIIICYCRLMPRHQKSFDEQYMKETYTIKEGHGYNGPENYSRMKHTEVQVQRHTRPASYAGDAEWRRAGREGRDGRDMRDVRDVRDVRDGRGVHCYVNRVPEPAPRDHALQYASSGMLDEAEGGAGLEALKTRSLPAFLRPKPRPLSTDDDLHHLYAKVNMSKKYKNRMRSEHAAIIALSKSHSQFLDADAVIVYDQRTAL